MFEYDFLLIKLIKKSAINFNSKTIHKQLIIYWISSQQLSNLFRKKKKCAWNYFFKHFLEKLVFVKTNFVTELDHFWLGLNIAHVFSITEWVIPQKNRSFWPIWINFENGLWVFAFILFEIQYVFESKCHISLHWLLTPDGESRITCGNGLFH